MSARNHNRREMGLPRLGFVACVLGVGIWVGVVPCAAHAEGSRVSGATPEFSEMLARCAPTVHPETMAAVVLAESRGHQFAIADAGPVKMPWAQRKALVRSYYLSSLNGAVAKASELIASGHTVSMGMAQVNDRNLARLGISIKEVFDPCTNIGAGGRILTEFYSRARKQFGPGEKALHAAISAYNSGDWVRGEKDGYVSRVYMQAGRRLALQSVASVPELGNSFPAPRKYAGREKGFSMSVADFVVTQ